MCVAFAPPRGIFETMAGDDTAEQQRRVLAVLALLFVVLLAGCGAPIASVTGTGDLTVEVVGEESGDRINGQEVTIKNEDTGDIVYQGSTGPSGTVATTLEESEYVVIVGETRDTVEVDEDGKTVELEVAVSPPKLAEA